MDIGQRALDYHKNGYNCAQSVFAACCEYTGLDEKTALALSAGFGGGARSGELCGAVTGAIMAEGLVFPFNDGQDTEAKDKIAAIAKQCVTIAREKYGYVRCASFWMCCKARLLPTDSGSSAAIRSPRRVKL